MTSSSSRLKPSASVDQAKCLGAYAGQGCKPLDIALYIDGREIKGLVPESGAPRTDVGTLQFHVDRSAKSDEQWADLLGAPAIGDAFFERPSAVSVGLQGDAPIPTDVHAFKIVRIHLWRFWICALILLLTVISIWLFAKNSALLRYRDKLSSFSLARYQMAFWFVLIIASFSFIWLITGAVDIVTNTALILIGIGAGTALGGAVIDRGKEQGAKTDLDKLISDKQKLQNDIDDLTSSGGRGITNGGDSPRKGEGEQESRRRCGGPTGKGIDEQDCCKQI